MLSILLYVYIIYSFYINMINYINYNWILFKRKRKWTKWLLMDVLCNLLWQLHSMETVGSEFEAMGPFLGIDNLHSALIINYSKENLLCNWYQIHWLSQRNCTVVQIQMMSATNDGGLRSWNHLWETVEHNDLVSQNKLILLTNFKSWGNSTINTAWRLEWKARDSGEKREFA